MTTGSLLLFFVLAVAAGMAVGPRMPRLWLALTLAGAAAAVGAAALVLVGGQGWELRSAVRVGGEAVHLRLDAISAMFLALLGVIGGAGAVYGRGYWSDADHPDSAPGGRLWWDSMMLAMGLVLLSSNGLHFLIAWELFAVSAYFLITIDRAKKETRAAGWLFFAASHAGTLCLFAFFAVLASHTGSWELGPVLGHAELAPLFWLALLGFGVKAGMFPLHVWLPSAHANAPSHVSALMSGMAINLGVYGIVRFSGWLPIPEAAGWVVMGAGAAGAHLGIAFALAQNDIKRLLAYCSVENIGIIFIGVGGAILGASHGNAPWGRLLLAGALLHVWNHGLYKALLFLCAGSVLHATGTRDMSRLGGLWRSMPWTAGLFAFGAVAIAGLPPLNGLVSEWLIYSGLFGAAMDRGASGWAAMPAAVALAGAGALALASFVKAGSVIFLGAERTGAAAGAHEAGRLMLGPMLALAGACALVGLAPFAFWSAAARAADQWHPLWAAPVAATPVHVLGLANLTLALLFAAAGSLLWRKASANGLRRSPTWDCGYAAPTARMQYTGGSLGRTAAGWFSWILRPQRSFRRPHGPFPPSSTLVERVPDTVLESVIEPVAGAAMRFALGARRLQHGRLQFYILYLLGGLAVLAVLALFG